MKTYNIYCLYDTRYPSEIRYIGLTNKDITSRLREHINESNAVKEGRSKGKNTYRYNWIYSNREFISTSLIEGDLAKTEAINKEVFYINLFKDKGCKLVNTVHGLSHYKDGYKLSDESRANMRASRNNPVTKELQRQAILGHEVSLETRTKISNTLKGRVGRKHTEESRKKMSEAKKLRDKLKRESIC